MGVPAPLSSPYLRHLCRAPRPPTQPTPQPLLGEEEQGWTGEPKEMRAVPERAGRQSRGRLCSSQWGSAWGPRSFLSCPGKPPLGGDLGRDLQMPSWVKALVPGKGPDSGTPGQGAPWWRRIEARLGGSPGESPSSDGTGEVGTPHADLRNKGPRAPPPARSWDKRHSRSLTSSLGRERCFSGSHLRQEKGRAWGGLPESPLEAPGLTSEGAVLPEP